MAMLVCSYLCLRCVVLTLPISKVFAESWQLRSQLKTDIRTQVRGLKTLFPDNFSGSPQQRTAIRDLIDVWVQDGSYLHDTVPGSVGAQAYHNF